MVKIVLREASRCLNGPPIFRFLNYKNDSTAFVPLKNSFPGRIGLFFLTISPSSLCLLRLRGIRSSREQWLACCCTDSSPCQSSVFPSDMIYKETAFIAANICNCSFHFVATPICLDKMFFPKCKNMLDVEKNYFVLSLDLDTLVSIRIHRLFILSF